MDVLQQIQDILEDKNMNWKNLTASAELENLVTLSYKQPQIIFKHSTRCSISSVAKNRIDKFDNDECDFYYLDVISNRDISNLIAEKFNVHHESPQVLLIKNGECIYDESHSSIYFEDIIDNIK